MVKAQNFKRCHNQMRQRYNFQKEKSFVLACPMCTKTFTSDNKYKEHYKLEHTVKKKA